MVSGSVEEGRVQDPLKITRGRREGKRKAWMNPPQSGPSPSTAARPTPAPGSSTATGSWPPPGARSGSATRSSTPSLGPWPSRSAPRSKRSRAAWATSDRTWIVAAGMLSSEVGLTAVPHVEAPAGIDALARGVAVRLLPEIADRPIVFVPGVRDPARAGGRRLGRGRRDARGGVRDDRGLDAPGRPVPPGPAPRRVGSRRGLPLAGLSYQAGRRRRRGDGSCEATPRWPAR